MPLRLICGLDSIRGIILWKMPMEASEAGIAWHVVLHENKGYYGASGVFGTLGASTSDQTHNVCQRVTSSQLRVC